MPSKGLFFDKEQQFSSPSGAGVGVVQKS